MAELERIISEKKQDAKSLFEYVFYQYNWGMPSARAKLQNALTPDALGFTPTTVKAFLQEEIQ